MHPSGPLRTSQFTIHHLPFAILFAFLLLLALFSLTHAAPTLELTVNPGVAEGETVRPGDVVTATVRLAYSGGTGPLATGLLVNLPAGAELAGSPTVEQIPNPSVNSVAVKRQGRTVGWQGSLRNEGSLLLHLPVRIGRCWGGFRTLTINAAAQRPDGGTQQTSATLRVHCPLATLGDIEVTQRVVRAGAAAWMPYAPELLPGQGVLLRTSFRNNSPVPVLLGVSRPRLLATAAAQLDVAQQRITLLHLPPGESRSLEQALKPGRNINPSALLDGDLSLTVGVVYCLITGEGRNCASSGQAESRAVATPDGCSDSATNQPRIPCPDPNQIPDPTSQVTVTIAVHPNDLGDAPDSRNHAGVNMAAYPGVTAHFPTVYAGLPGDPNGPLHRYPRPVHLGAFVSMEAEADSGPDADPTNNLLPGQGGPDRDRFDDGVGLASLSLAHCQPARMQAQVWLQSNQAKQILVNKGVTNLYLNLWIDSNRDGDWNDYASCSPQLADLAREHIVIDYPVPLAGLTPGGNRLNVVSGVNAFWPANQTDKSAWLRVTLSEEKSPKLTGRIYGDGRGPEGGYRLGETEDYLWRPPGSADVEVTQGGAWVEHPLFGTNELATDRYAQFRISYQNRGNAPARNVTITQTVALSDAPVLVDVSTPGLPDGAVKTGNGTVSVYIQEIPSGAQGTILVGWKPQSVARGIATSTRISATVTAASPGDVDTSNNSASSDVSETPFLRMGLRTTNSPVLLQSALTCRTGVEVVGIAPPGVTVYLSVDGATLPNPVTANAAGRWQRSLTGLSDGLHVIRGWTDLNDSDPGIALSLLVRVDSSLPIDPASFAVTDAAGRSFGIHSTVWDDTDIVHLVGGGPFTVGVNSCAALTGVDLGYVGETEKNITLADSDGDGRFTGIFDPGGLGRSGAAAGLALIATTAAGETRLSLSAQAETPGQVISAVSGEPIAGATVALLAETANPSSSGVSFGGLAVDAGHGQANPQTTGADGSFYFAPPPGVYRLMVSAPGYQPRRSAAVEVDAGGVSPYIFLMPIVSEEPDVTVVIGVGGFAPERLLVPPGTVVEWINSDLAEHSSYGELWDSGVLWPGERFRVRFDNEGENDYWDGENPLNSGLVTIDLSAPQPGTQWLYLPAIQR